MLLILETTCACISSYIIEHPAFICRLVVEQCVCTRIRNKRIDFVILRSDDAEKGFTDKLSEA